MVKPKKLVKISLDRYSQRGSSPNF